MKVRAATWNIEGGGGTDENFEGAVDFLARNPVDVLVVTEAQWRQREVEGDRAAEDTRRRLQYMERHMRSDGARMIGRVATAPGTTCHIATFYNADLLTGHGYDVRTHGIWHVRSSFRLAAKGVPADEAIRFVGVHGHPFDGDDRVALAHLNRGYATRKALLLGDFNCVPESFGPIDFSKIKPSSYANDAVLNPITGKIERDQNGNPITDHRSVNILLEAGLIDIAAAYSDERPTNNPDNNRPPKRIDLILASPLIREQVVGYGLLGDADYKQALAFSDHVAVYADMAM